MSRFFLGRPIFAWVIAIVIMLAGILSITRLPVSQYPQIAPPQVTITATYPGASAETIENTITQQVEQAMTGLDGYLYMASNSDSSGRVSIDITFEAGTDPDIAQVQVQNRLKTVENSLPQVVQQLGVNVDKSAANFLMVVGFVDKNGKMSSADLSDYLVNNVQEPLRNRFHVLPVWAKWKCSVALTPCVFGLIPKSFTSTPCRLTRSLRPLKSKTYRFHPALSVTCLPRRVMN